MNVKVKLFLLCLLLLLAGCITVYEKGITGVENFSKGCWSPSKKQIVFARYYDAHRGVSITPDLEFFRPDPKYLYKSFGLFIFDTETKKVHKITNLKGNIASFYVQDVHISWSGDLITYYGECDDENYYIYILNSNGSNKRLLVKGGRMSDISPDAKKVVYLKGDEYTIGESEVWVIDVDGRNNHLISKIPDLIVDFAKWEQDGENILLKGSTLGGGYREWSVYELNLDTKEIKKTNSPYPENYGNNFGVKGILKEANIPLEAWGDRVFHFKDFYSK